MKKSYLNSCFSVLVVGILLSACGGKREPSAGALVARPESSSPDNKDNEFKKDSAQFDPINNDRGYDVQRYKLSGSFNWPKKTLEAEVKIEFILRDQSIQEIELDSSVSKVLSVKNSNGKDLSFFQPSDKALLKISVAELAPTGLRHQIAIRYESVANKGPSLFNQEAQNGLHAISPTPEDPVKVPVVYTTSEPNAASSWMPCNDRPSDRAMFSTDFTVPETEAFVSNGRLTFDEKNSGTRRMRYETSYSLPTYLMAFAMGAFEERTIMHGKLPVSTWARKALPVNLSELTRISVSQIKKLESLVGNFPFEKYAVVMLPEFPAGGIEHASITFNAEAAMMDVSSGKILSGTRDLMAHELAHQWFGDYMTVQSWDDLWIKEGMATLLTTELKRSFVDVRNQNIRLSSDFEINDGDAILDPKLPPPDKYTSGPYDRAAWFLSQVREEMGSEEFYETLREVLKKNAFRYISTDAFMESFREGLGEKFNKAKASLQAHRMFQVRLENAQAPHPTGSIKISLFDPENVLLTPFNLDWLKVDGALKNHEELQPNTPVVVDALNDDFLVIDAEDHHPNLETLLVDDTPDLKQKQRDLLNELKKLMLPPAKASLKVFARVPVPSQAEVLRNYNQLEITPSDFEYLFSETPSVLSQEALLQSTCLSLQNKSQQKALNFKGSDAKQWKDTLEEALIYIQNLKHSSKGALHTCRDFVGPELFQSSWDLINSNPQDPKIEPRLLSKLQGLGHHDPSQYFKTFIKLFNEGASFYHRIQALQALVVGAESYAKSGRLSPENKLLIEDRLREHLRTGSSDWALYVSMNYFAKIGNLNVLSDLRVLLGRDDLINDNPKRNAICAAYKITHKKLESGQIEERSPEASQLWKDFYRSAVSEFLLAEPLVQLAKDPKTCLEGDDNETSL